MQFCIAFAIMYLLLIIVTLKYEIRKISGYFTSLCIPIQHSKPGTISCPFELFANWKYEYNTEYLTSFPKDCKILKAPTLLYHFTQIFYHLVPFLIVSHLRVTLMLILKIWPLPKFSYKEVPFCSL